MAYNYILWDRYGSLISGDSNRIYGTESTGPNGGRDVIKGLGGEDFIYANSGNDIIDGGSGSDLLNSGYGDDIFYFGRNSGWDTIKDLGRTTGNRDKIVVEGNYNGYYNSPITGEVVLKFDHNRDGSTDARVLLSGVYEAEWRSLQASVIVTNPFAPEAVLAKTELQHWDQVYSSYFAV